MLRIAIFIFTAVELIGGSLSWQRLNATEPHELASKLPVASTHVDLDAIPAWLEQLSPAAKRGYRHLIEKVYLPADLDEAVAVELERMLQGREANDGLSADKEAAGAASATETELRTRLLAYYGLTPRPGDAEARDPLQYVVTENGQWVMNCFSCHGGAVYGTPLPGAPNNAYQLQSFVEDIRTAKLSLSKPLGHMEIGSLFMPLGTTAGTLNAVMFGVALMKFLDADLNVLPLRP